MKNKILALVLMGCALSLAKPAPSHAILTVTGSPGFAGAWFTDILVGGMAVALLSSHDHDLRDVANRWGCVALFIIFLDNKEGNATPKFLAPNSQVIEEARLLPNEVRSYTSEIPRMNENAAQVLAEASRLKQEGNDDRKIAQISYDRVAELSQEMLSPDALSAFTKIRNLMRERAENSVAALH
jgi:hypothetical protein